MVGKVVGWIGIILGVVGTLITYGIGQTLSLIDLIAVIISFIYSIGLVMGKRWSIYLMGFSFVMSLIVYFIKGGLKITLDFPTLLALGFVALFFYYFYSHRKYFK